MSIKEIFETLGKGNCDLVTVYRSMHMLETMEMVKRFDFGDGIAGSNYFGKVMTDTTITWFARTARR